VEGGKDGHVYCIWQKRGRVEREEGLKGGIEDGRKGKGERERKKKKNT
jgi:hypothetical protein